MLRAAIAGRAGTGEPGQATSVLDILKAVDFLRSQARPDRRVMRAVDTKLLAMDSRRILAAAPASIRG